MGLFWIFSGSAILSLAYWLALIWICFDLYRRYHFQSLPWLGAYCVVSTVHIIVGTLLATRWTSLAHQYSPHEAAKAVARLVSLWPMITSACHWLISAMILSEIAFLINKAYGESSSRLVSFLLKIHRNVRILGCVLLLLALSSFALVFWIIAATP